MSVAILISGCLFKDPQQRTSQSGKRYVTTTLKAAAADNASSDFWNVLAFGDTAGDALMRLAVGERVAVQGSLKLDLYVAAGDGKQKISRTVFCDHVLAVRQPPKAKAAKEAPTSQGAVEKDAAAGGPAFFSDPIPFEAAR